MCQSPALGRSGQEFDLAGVQVVTCGHDLDFAFFDQIGHDGAFTGDLAGSAQSALTHGVVHKITRLAGHSLGGRHDGIHHRPDRGGELGFLFHHFAGGCHGAAALMAQHHDQRHAQNSCAVFDGAHGCRVGHVAGIACNKQLANAQTAKEQFGWHAAVSAGNDRSPRWR